MATATTATATKSVRINVASLIKRINAKGIEKKNAEINAKNAYYNGLIAKVKYINENFLEDAKKLIELFKVMKANNLEPFGKKTDYYFPEYTFKADGIHHQIGFITYKDGGIAIGCLGGGWDENTSAILALNGNNLMWGDECGNAKGDMIAMLSAPSANTLNVFEKHLDGIIKHFEDRINTIYNGFIKFRDEYLAYIGTQLKK